MIETEVSVELNSCNVPAVPHQGLVVPDQLHGVLELPAVATEVFKARQVSAEVRTLLQETVAAKRVLQVWIHLDLLGELQSLDFNERSRDSLHVALGVAESDSSRANGILVSVSVDAGVDDSAEQVVEDVSETFGVEHSVESSDKDGLLRIQPLTGTSDVVAVCQDPWNDLHLLASHSTTGDAIVPGTST